MTTKTTATMTSPVTRSASMMGGYSRSRAPAPPLTDGPRAVPCPARARYEIATSSFAAAAMRAASGM
jgi:hypothetical protein